MSDSPLSQVVAISKVRQKAYQNTVDLMNEERGQKFYEAMINAGLEGVKNLTKEECVQMIEDFKSSHPNVYVDSSFETRLFWRRENGRDAEKNELFKLQEKLGFFLATKPEYRAELMGNLSDEKKEQITGFFTDAQEVIDEYDQVIADFQARAGGNLSRPYPDSYYATPKYLKALALAKSFSSSLLPSIYRGIAVTRMIQPDVFKHMANSFAQAHYGSDKTVAEMEAESISKGTSLDVALAEHLIKYEDLGTLDINPDLKKRTIRVRELFSDIEVITKHAKELSR